MRVLSIGDAVSIATIVDCAQRTAPVARLVDGDVIYGTARSVGFGPDRGFVFLGAGDDVRDAFLRVTTSMGWEAGWPISELIPEVRSGEFVVDYRP